MKCIAVLAFVGTASAFLAPVAVSRRPTNLQMSRFDGKVWDIDAKVEIYNEWDPTKERSGDNFNPFETNSDGNSCDTCGYFPGEGRYVDPIRPKTNWAYVQREKEIMDGIKAQGPKPGQPGPGNYQGFDKHTYPGANTN